MDRGEGRHGVDTGIMFQTLGPNQKTAVHADPVPICVPLYRLLDLNIDTGDFALHFISCSGDGFRLQVEYGLISGDALRKVGCLLVCRGGEPSVIAVIPIIDLPISHKIVTNQSGGEGLRGMSNNPFTFSKTN